MARDIDLLLGDILKASRDTVEYVAGLDRAVFLSLPETGNLRYRALKNALSELGGAVKGLPMEYRDLHPEGRWKGFAALRDIVAHQYFRLDMSRLWLTVSEEIPALIPVMERLIAEIRDKDEDTPGTGPGR